MKKVLSLLSLGLLATVGLFALLRLNQPTVTAQGDLIPLPQSTGAAAVATPDEAVLQQITMENRIEFFENKTVADYRVVYLIAPDALPAGDLLSSNGVQELLPSVLVANNWEELLALNAESPIQGMMIHVSALPFIDTTWTQNAYKHGVGMNVIDMTYDQRALVTGDYCQLKEVAPQIVEGIKKSEVLVYSDNYPTGKHTAMFSYWVVVPTEGSTEVDYDGAAEAYLQECRQYPPSFAGVGGIYSTSGPSIVAPSEDLTEFLHSIKISGMAQDIIAFSRANSAEQQAYMDSLNVSDSMEENN